MEPKKGISSWTKRSRSADEHSSGEYLEPNDQARINQYLFLKRLEMSCAGISIWPKKKASFWHQAFKKLTLHGKRTEDLLTLFTMNDNLCFCNGITEFFEQLKVPYHKTSLWLFIDASKDSIKAVLLHNVNTLPSFPIAYSTTLKESYENLKAILTSIQYDYHNWNICADFKVVTMLPGLELG